MKSGGDGDVEGGVRGLRRGGGYGNAADLEVGSGEDVDVDLGGGRAVVGGVGVRDVESGDSDAVVDGEGVSRGVSAVDGEVLGHRRRNRNGEVRRSGVSDRWRDRAVGGAGDGGSDGDVDGAGGTVVVERLVDRDREVSARGGGGRSGLGLSCDLDVGRGEDVNADLGGGRAVVSGVGVGNVESGDSDAVVDREGVSRGVGAVDGEVLGHRRRNRHSEVGGSGVSDRWCDRAVGWSGDGGCDGDVDRARGSVVVEGLIDGDREVSAGVSGGGSGFSLSGYLHVGGGEDVDADLGSGRAVVGGVGVGDVEGGDSDAVIDGESVSRGVSAVDGEVLGHRRRNRNGEVGRTRVSHRWCDRAVGGSGDGGCDGDVDGAAGGAVVVERLIDGDREVSPGVGRGGSGLSLSCDLDVGGGEDRGRVAAVAGIIAGVWIPKVQGVDRDRGRSVELVVGGVGACDGPGYLNRGGRAQR